MAEQPKRKCPICGKEIWDLRRRYYCSSNCEDAAADKEAAEAPPKPKRRPPPNPRPADTDATTAAANTGPPNGEPAKPRKWIKFFKGKRSPELIAAIFDDMAQYNMTQEQACYGHGLRPETFSRWINEPGCEGLLARAQFHQIKRLIFKQETEPEDWKRWQWRLQVTYRQQFGDPARIGVQLNQQFNGDSTTISNSEELSEARKRLDEAKTVQAEWKTGAKTASELREILANEIAERQSIVDFIDRGGTLDQQEQEQLRQRWEEQNAKRRDRDQQPGVRSAVGHVVGERPALMDSGASESAPRPEPSQPAPEGSSTRASDLDTESGQPMSQGNRPITGPPSERQYELRRKRLEWERARRGGEGKQPF